jgi:hypothetical protein
LCLALAGAMFLVPALEDDIMHKREALLKMRQTLRVAPVVSAPVQTASERNHQAFMDTMGDARHLEQQVKTLFAVARGVGLELKAAACAGLWLTHPDAGAGKLRCTALVCRASHGVHALCLAG